MRKLSTIAPTLWEEAKQIARQTNYPEKQPPDCPYIVIKTLEENQLIILSGFPRKGLIQLFLSTIRPPHTKSQDFKLPDPLILDQAQLKANKLLLQATRANHHTSSTNNQTHIKPQSSKK